MPLISVRVDMAETLREFKGIRDDQLPFAIVNGLTQTAKDSQLSVQKELPLRFTIRRLAFMQKNIKIVSAKKKDAEPWASVEDTGGPEGQIAADMGLQETGGTKFPAHKQWICVPIMGGARRPGGWVSPQNMPQELMKPGGGGFIRGNVMYKRGADYKRPKSYMKVLGPGAAMSGTARAKITPMYALVSRASLPKRYGFEDVVRMVVTQMWPREFEAAFKEAVRTAR